ncbi:hypothetical protein PBI_SCTP2_173 [Salicola phage SCTP-2]|nr:hypothetical protein PBI_SCTP2_173 [Salicola phage SCTP-2]
MEDVKQRLADYINEYVKEQNEQNFEVVDLFYMPHPTSGKLTFTGFRKIKNLYDFYELEFEINNSPLDYNTLCKVINGFYYIYNKNQSSKKIRMQTTDRKFVNKMKISQYDFEVFKNHYIDKSHLYG